MHFKKYILIVNKDGNTPSCFETTTFQGQSTFLPFLLTIPVLMSAIIVLLENNYKMDSGATDELHFEFQGT